MTLADISGLFSAILTQIESATVSAIVASLCTLFWVRGYEALRFRRLRRAFGKRLRSSEDIAISVPLWKALPASRSTVRFSRQNYEGREEQYYGPDEMINRNDALASASVIELFGDFFPKPIRYINDCDEPLWGRCSVAIIGAPLANFHARRFFDLDTERKLQAIAPRFVEIEENDQSEGKYKIVVPNSEKVVPKLEKPCDLFSNETTDYGVIIRIQNPFSEVGDRYVFIVAGIHAESTQEAGKMLRENWPLFCGQGDVKALVFDMVRCRPMTGRIIYKVGI